MILLAPASVLLASLVVAMNPAPEPRPLPVPLEAEPLLRSRPDLFGPLLADAPTFRLQLLISTVADTPAGPTITTTAFRADAEYLYPASTIKLCAAVAALQTIQDLRAAASAPNLPAVSVDTPLALFRAGDAAPPLTDDPTNLSRGDDHARITVRHELRKLFLVSDNEAFNRLYDLVGHRALNERMHAAGLPSVVINHRLSDGRSMADNRKSPRVDFGTPPGPRTIPARTSDLELANAPREGLAIGTGFARGDAVTPGPTDFTHRNGISLLDLHRATVMALRPDIDLGLPGFGLTPEHTALLREAMTSTPAASPNPLYDPAPYPDDYVKPLRPGLARALGGEPPPIANKMGQAYGFTLDTAEIVHAGRTVFVTAAIYTNADGVLNDDRYEYATVAEPFLAALGEAIGGAMLSPAPAPLPATP